MAPRRPPQSKSAKPVKPAARTTSAQASAQRGKPAKAGAGPRPAVKAGASNPASAIAPLLIIGFGLIAVGMIAALPTVPIVLLGMVPTMVALFVDRSYHKTAAICVAGLNFAGVAPFVSVLWRGSNSLSQSMTILGDVYTWLAMYTAAALGWMLYMVLPPLAASILRIVSEQRTAILRAQQRKIGEEWGIGLAPTAAAAAAPAAQPAPVKQ